MKSTSLAKFVSIGLVCFSLIACTPTANPNKNLLNNDQKLAGFFEGCWHGAILPVTFVSSLFNSDINIYETHNNGSWYNFGFLLGVGGLLGIRFNVWGQKGVVNINLLATDHPDSSNLAKNENNFKQD